MVAEPHIAPSSHTNTHRATHTQHNRIQNTQKNTYRDANNFAGLRLGCSRLHISILLCLLKIIAEWLVCQRFNHSPMHWPLFGAFSVYVSPFRTHTHTHTHYARAPAPAPRMCWCDFIFALEKWMNMMMRMHRVAARQWSLPWSALLIEIIFFFWFNRPSGGGNRYAVARHAFLCLCLMLCICTETWSAICNAVRPKHICWP